jgi:hypothetical protein
MARAARLAPVVPSACAALWLAAAAPATAQVRTIVSSYGTANSWFGSSAVVVGDVDGDGRADFLVGALHDGGAGSATIRSGRDGSELRRHDGEMANSDMGAAVELVGDVDGDGVADYVVSSPKYFDPVQQVDCGKLYVFSGATGALIWSKLGFGSGKSWGSQLAYVGDVDGDGIGDFVVNKVKGGLVQGGRVELTSGADGTTFWVFDAPVKDFNLGLQVVRMPDVDGDGIREVAVSSPQDSTGGQYGRMTLLSCRTGSELWSVMGEVGDVFAVWISNGGDYDGDGVDDVAVGAPGAGPNVAGQVQFYSGVDGASLGAIIGDWASAQIGYRFSPGFDADGDGDPDLALARYDVTLVEKLSLFDARSHQKIAEIQSGGGGAADYATLLAAGDLDQDGFGDLLRGKPHEGGTGALFVDAFRSPPALASVAPVRGDHHGGTAVTLHGSGFALANSLQVTFGGVAATGVHVVDDATITCVTPATASGPLDVGVSHDAGSATAAGAFAATPATLLEGDDFLGGSFTQRTLCAPNDWLLAVIGQAPEVSIPIHPFEGALAVSPFFVEFIVHQGPDEFDLGFTIPNDPALAGVEVLFQSLAGPQLVGAGKSGTWTNCAHLVIQ